MAKFATTHWSMVVAARDGDSSQAQAALECLCRSYWYPVYAFIQRRGHSAEDARDLTQEFFARLLERNSLCRADPVRGRFRSFLLVSVRNFLSDAWDRSRAAKRQGDATAIPFEELGSWEHLAAHAAREHPPDLIFEENWARSVLGHTCRKLREEYASSGRTDRFEALEQFLPSGAGDLTYGEIAGRLGVSEAAVRSEIHRLRTRFRALLRREIAHTVATSEEIDEEIHFLMSVLAH
ncbi:MAG: sigma-70 family RNA polymerase sigma factor [Verrucomicrobiales bacterium]|nr:sigma-70 family RNA polymerase sigma factor [Verrucomicrobiales bacterium]